MGIGACMHVVNRPSPPRKKVKCFLVSSEDEKKPKEFTIEKGRVTLLKDIPFKYKILNVLVKYFI
jgi:hypothetical protein